jgi:short-subunit dehydrogenase
MSEYVSIGRFAKRARTKLERIGIFVANASVARNEYHEVNGHKKCIAVNVISTTLLMANITPKMRETAS